MMMTMTRGGLFAHQQQRSVDMNSALLSDETNDEGSHDSYIDLSTLDDVKSESSERPEPSSRQMGGSEIKSECLCKCGQSATVVTAESVDDDDDELREENLNENVFDEMTASSESFIKGME